LESRHVSSYCGKKLTQVPLSIPVVILGKQKRGFYIHCEVYHDEAIKYQSYYTFEEIVAQDKHIALYPGQARCGYSAFDKYGRWRTGRAFTGTVIYRSIKKIWSPCSHLEFPNSFKSVVKLLLMMSNRTDNLWSLLPREVFFEIIHYMDWDWFEVEKKRKTSERSLGLGRMLSLDWWDY